MNTQPQSTQPSLPFERRAPAYRLVDASEAQLYSTDFAPLAEGTVARLLLHPGRANDLAPGAVIVYRGTRFCYRLRIEAYLPERSAGGRRGKAPSRSNRMSVKVLSIDAAAPQDPVPCAVCKGSGAVEIPGVCPECNGHAHGCADCDGSGRIDWSECSACHGHGRAART